MVFPQTAFRIIFYLSLLEYFFASASWTGTITQHHLARTFRGGSNKHQTKVKKQRLRKKLSSRKKEEDAEQSEMLKTALLEIKSKPNVLVVSASNNEVDDPSVIYLSRNKMKQLDLYNDDTVIIQGRRGRQTLCCVQEDLTVDAEVRMVEVIQEDLRVKPGDSISITAQPNVKYASSVKFTVFESSLKEKPSFADLKDKYLIPYFKGKGRPVYCGSVFKVNNLEFMVVDLITNNNENSKDIFGSVLDSTELVMDEKPLSSKDDLRLSEIGYDDLGGCQEQINDIKELVELPLKYPKIFHGIGIPPPKGVLMFGPPGSGKTSLARAVASESGAYFFSINGPEIMSKLAGESENNLRKAFEAVKKNAPSILFFDELDSIATSREKAGGEVERRMVSQLLTLMDSLKEDSNVVVMAATNRPSVLDSALRRFGRFDREIDIGIPDDLGRIEILKIKTKSMKLSPEVDIEQLGKDTHGYVGADLSQLCLEAGLSCIREQLGSIDMDAKHVHKGILDKLLITPEHFAAGMKACLPSTLRESHVEVPSCSWEDVGGLEEVKTELHETITYPVEHADKFLKFGLTPSKGTLFFGPPGCGKTLLARAVANECGANFLSVKGPELLTMWFGESEANVRALFEKARAASPCILFFDEIDSIAKARGGGGGSSEATDRVINQILTEIDGVGVAKPVFVIGATNRPDILDPAITRPGRLDHLIYIPLPDAASRVSIFKSCLRNSPVATDVNFEAMANVTQGFSGADITEICQRASKFAIAESIAEDLERAELLKQGKISSIDDIPDKVTEIESRHFTKSMSLARRSVPETMVQQYEAYVKSMALGSAQASAFKFEEDPAENTSDMYAE